MHPLHAPPLHSGRMCPQLRKQEHKEKLNVSLAPQNVTVATRSPHTHLLSAGLHLF